MSYAAESLLVGRRILLYAACAALIGCGKESKLDFGSGLDVPYVQTSPAVVHRMLEMAHLSRGETLIDLGCGDGRIVIAAARDFGAKGIGYDIDPQRILEARKNARHEGVDEMVRFEQQDFFKAPIAQAHVLTMFMLPPVMDRIEPKIRSELGKGTRIVSHSFPFRGWQPEQVVHFEGRTLYLFVVPERAPLRVR